MKAAALLALAALALAGCDLRHAVFGFPQPQVTVAAPGAPIELAYRKASGGIVIVTGRVNDRAAVDFVLDTGAPVTVLLDGPLTAALDLDSSEAQPLGDRDDPAAPFGDIQEGFRLDFGGVSLSGLAVVVVPQESLPCQERFEAIGFGGVIGADLFRRFVVEIDPAASRIRLHEPATWRTPPGTAVLPIAFRNGHAFVDAKLLLAGGAVVQASMHLDTGLNRALTLVAGAHPAIAMPATGKLRKSCLVNGVREEREGEAATVELAGVRLPVAAPIYSEAPNVVTGGRSGTLGAALFAGRRIFIDYPGKRLVIGDAAPPA